MAQHTIISNSHIFLTLVYLCDLCPDGFENGIKIKYNFLDQNLLST